MVCLIFVSNFVRMIFCMIHILFDTYLNDTYLNDTYLYDTYLNDTYLNELGQKDTKLLTSGRPESKKGG